MKNHFTRAVASAAAAAVLAAVTLPAIPTSMAAVQTGIAVKSVGQLDDRAYLRGNAEVVKDNELGSNVLSLKGGSFGAGWLELPELFKNGCEKGFTFSMKYRLNSDVTNYSRLFQFATVPFGTGNAPSYSSPDISVDVKDKTSFRASIFAGTGDSTLDDEKHRAIFDLDAAPDSGKWHELTLVCSGSDATYYIDNEKVGYEADTISDTMSSLFSEKVLDKYIYNSIGHSLYSDNDISMSVDDITFYDVYNGQISNGIPLYRYTFEGDSVTKYEIEVTEEKSKSRTGAEVTSLPTLMTTSPSGKLVTKIWYDNNGSYYYSVDKAGGETVISPSKMGLVLGNEDLSSGFPKTAPAATITPHDETYTMPYGKHTTIRDCYNEISFPLVKGNSILTVYIRTYDDGIGLRYALNKGATIKEESTEVIFPGGSKFWGNWPNATYEWDIVELPKDRANETNATYSLPYTGVLGNNSTWVTVSEASVFNEPDPYCAGAVQFLGNYHSLRFKGGVKVSGISMNKAFHTPWRAVVIGDTLDEMSSSDLILNLNPPSQIEDTSWIRPGKTAWSWWSSGGDSPVMYHTQKDYIDFAANNGWDFVCLDFGWALWDDSEAKVRELCEYAAERGIGIYLWYGVNNTGHKGYKDSKGNPAYPYYSLLDEATIVREFERIHGLGVQGVKVDYYESDTQATMKQMYLCATIAAKNHLMVLFHGCTIPRGESRTFPNIVSFEAINGSEYYKWFESPSLANRVSYTFTRNVVGSADFTPTGIPIYGIKATAGFALADVVTIESGIQHFAHSVYTYEGNPALPLLNDVPVAWEDMKVLDGYPMQFNVTARRSSDEWFIGASTLQARTIDIKLSDLISDGVYNAYIFGDNADGSAIEIKKLEGLTSKDTITQKLLANGGCVIKLTKNQMNLTTPYSNYQFYEAENAKLGGGAKLTTGKDAKYSSNSAYVGYVGGSGGGSVTFANVRADKDGEYPLRIYYISGEYRSLKVDVNGQFTAKLDNLFANQGDWSGIRAVNTTVKLKAGDNTIKLYNDQGNAPSIDRIALAIPLDKCIGDVNLDGTVSAADLVCMERYLLKAEKFSKQQFEKADLDGDGTVDTFDLIKLRKILTTIVWDN
ncbi:MAG: glycoside hydrolase family 97 catalytic domain-containing protein [Ruminococcus sp.]|nr:glycoside hydrolase family 97 catalytic domain-containing protein [Ruminococcus sp.]